VLTAEAHQNNTPTAVSSDATATTADVHLLNSGLGYAVNAQSIVASVTCNADESSASSSSAGSEIQGLVIAGKKYGTIAEPKSITLTDPITKTKIEVKILEKVTSGAAAGEPQPNPTTHAFETGLVVNGIHVKVTDAKGAVIAEVVVAHAECQAAFSPVCEEFPHVSGDGYVLGVQADETLIDPDNQLVNKQVGTVKLPSTGGKDDATAAHVGPIGTDSQTVAESNTAFSHTEGTVDNANNTASSQTVSEVQQLRLIDTGTAPTNPFIGANVVRAECTAQAGPSGTGSSTGSTTIAGLSIGGQDVCSALGLSPTASCQNAALCCQPAPNTDVCAALSLTPLCDALNLTITLNEQSGAQSGDPTDITVNAIHVHVGDPIPGGNGADVVVSHAHCDAGTGAQTP
jgi:hypothetical protein